MEFPNGIVMETEIFDWKEGAVFESFRAAFPNGHVVTSGDDQIVYVYADQPITLAQAQRFFDQLFNA